MFSATTCDGWIDDITIWKVTFPVFTLRRVTFPVFTLGGGTGDAVPRPGAARGFARPPVTFAEIRGR